MGHPALQGSELALARGCCAGEFLEKIRGGGRREVSIPRHPDSLIMFLVWKIIWFLSINREPRGGNCTSGCRWVVAEAV